MPQDTSNPMSLQQWLILNALAAGQGNLPPFQPSPPPAAAAAAAAGGGGGGGGGGQNLTMGGIFPNLFGGGQATPEESRAATGMDIPQGGFDPVQTSNIFAQWPLANLYQIMGPGTGQGETVPWFMQGTSQIPASQFEAALAPGFYPDVMPGHGQQVSLGYTPGVNWPPGPNTPIQMVPYGTPSEGPVSASQPGAPSPTLEGITFNQQVLGPGGPIPETTVPPFSEPTAIPSPSQTVTGTQLVGTPDQWGPGTNIVPMTTSAPASIPYTQGVPNIDISQGAPQVGGIMYAPDGQGGYTMYDSNFNVVGSMPGPGTTGAGFDPSAYGTLSVPTQAFPAGADSSGGGYVSSDVLTQPPSGILFDSVPAPDVSQPGIEGMAAPPDLPGVPSEAAIPASDVSGPGVAGMALPPDFPGVPTDTVAAPATSYYPQQTGFGSLPGGTAGLGSFSGGQLPATFQSALTHGIWSGKGPMDQNTFNQMISWLNYQGNATGQSGPAFGGLSYQQYVSMWNSLRSRGSTGGAAGKPGGAPPASQTNVEGAIHAGAGPKGTS
jgi:hypothetical protein